MSELALFGGNKAVVLDYASIADKSLITEKGIEHAVELMRKGTISSAPVVREFEQRFANYIGTKFCLTTSNGTSAIHEALFACGVSPGDEVIAPSYTYWATCAPIVACGAKVVFCDVDIDTFNIDPKDFENRITKKTKAVVLTHVWGVPCDMDEIIRIANKHNVAVIEDACHAHGSLYKGKKCGSLADIGCFSLQGGKHLVGGEGGMITTDNRNLYERCLALGHYERLDALPSDSEYKKYSLTGLGMKHRVHPLAIAIANAGMDIFEERNAIRNKNAKKFEDGIKDCQCIIPQKLYDGSERQYSYHFVKFDGSKLGDVSAYSFIKALSAEGMKVGICGYGRLHKAPLFIEGVPFGNGNSPICSKPVDLPVTDHLLYNTFLIAPRFETEESEALINQYIDAVRKVCSNIDELREYDKTQNKDVYNEVSSRSINAL